MNLYSFTGRNGNDRLNRPTLGHTLSFETTSLIYAILGAL
jgi:hypothetical protein